MRLDGAGQRFDRARHLEIDVEPRPGQGLEEFVHGGDRVPATDPDLAQLRPGQPLGYAAGVRDPVKGVVVKAEQHAVARHVHVSLQVPVAQGGGTGEGEQGVLSGSIRVRRVAAAVGERGEPGVEVAVVAGLHGLSMGDGVDRCEWPSCLLISRSVGNNRAMPDESAPLRHALRDALPGAMKSGDTLAEMPSERPWRPSRTPSRCRPTRT